MTTSSGDSTRQWAGALRLGPSEKPRPAVPTLREVESAGNTLDVDVDQQLLGKSAVGNSLPYVLLPEARLDGSVGEECTSPCVAEEAMVVAFRLGSDSCDVRLHCCNLFI